MTTTNQFCYSCRQLRSSSIFISYFIFMHTIVVFVFRPTHKKIRYQSVDLNNKDANELIYEFTINQFNQADTYYYYYYCLLTYLCILQSRVTNLFIFTRNQWFLFDRVRHPLTTVTDHQRPHRIHRFPPLQIAEHQTSHHE